MNYWNYIFLFICFLPRRITIHRWTRKLDFISNITIWLFCVKPETSCRWWLQTFPYNYIIRHIVSWMPPPTKKRLGMKNKWGNIWISPPSNKIWIGGFQAAAGVINHPWKTNCSNNQTRIISLIRSKYANLLYLKRKGQLCIIGQLCWVGWIILHCYVK